MTDTETPPVHTAEEILLETPLFSLLDEEERDALESKLLRRQYEAGKVLFNKGDQGDTLFIVRRGNVEIYLKETTGEKIILAECSRGDIFGELALFDEGPRSAFAVTTEETELYLLSRETLTTFLHNKPAAAMDILAMMARRLRASDELLLTRASKNPNIEIEEELTWVQKTATFIAEFSGSMTFLFLNATFFAVWISLNLGVLPWMEPFDPYPFGLLTTAVSLEAIFLSIFVLLSQNLQSAKDRIRGDIEYQVNIRAELEINELHQKVDALHEKVLEELEILKRR
jgi:CRP/FNR family cyclic AMP-dependent transcriptional regulator